MIHLSPASLACALVGLSLIPLPAFAQSAQKNGTRHRAAPIAMLCAFEDKGASGWVPEIVMITRQENGRIEVFDPILQTLVGRPIKAVVVADSKKERSYGWALAGVRNAAGQWSERIDFRLTVTKADATAKMVVTPKGYDNVITGDGICGAPAVKPAG
ncbi:hypothetical protein [Paracoccus aminophilus]|uniref:Uncharacterized protein n=1 Tax=Paracoccus aminophilus JCM 7686 TaxID=1367847 RepID=S5YE30_PARAH|nr:hypothetical protein [Paracoccus aminophilus]AGT09743.1 hypothetical protein JCM7686_2687 [Paracoccus aminophilus JCM 7686]